MPKGAKNRLPERFEPLLAQARTQGALRYGAQESGLQGIFDDTTQNYTRQSAAQEGAARSLLGSLQSASVGLNSAYSDAGLTPEIRAQYANTPDGQRILASLARGQADIQQQQLGAQAGRQYIQQRLGDDYRSDVGKINQQAQAERTERGLYESSLLDQLIGSDRSMRHDANAATRKQAFDAQQALDQRNAARDNALIGQGLLPDSEGNLQPLPGGKADPDAPANKAKTKRTSGPGTASPEAQRSVGNDFKKAFGLAKGLKGDQPSTPEIRQAISGTLTNGKPASTGKVVYEEVPVLDAAGRPTGKTKRQPKLDANGQQVTSSSRPAVPAFDAPVAAAATEQAMFGYVTTATVRELQKLGYSVNQIPGMTTEGAYRKAHPQKPYSMPAPASRPG